MKRRVLLLAGLLGLASCGVPDPSPDPPRIPAAFHGTYFPRPGMTRNDATDDYVAISERRIERHESRCEVRQVEVLEEGRAIRVGGPVVAEGETQGDGTFLFRLSPDGRRLTTDANRSYHRAADSPR